MMKIVFALNLFLTSVCYATEESIYTEIARFRQYESGADESDLKVQPILNGANGKKKKQTDPESNEGF